MARKSRKIQEQPAPVMQEPAIRAALYIRLSVEDGKGRSISVETQQLILDHYLESKPEIFVYDTYIDNGATGTNFHRPGFQRMLTDIEDGRINCVIVKDLSRLGRNSIDTGYYIEQYFPQHKVRFIAVNDQYDSANPDNVHAGIILPLKNMINEAYALDIGRKIKAQQRQAMKDGKFVGSQPPYGYLKSSTDCHQLIVDPVTAPIVRQMFAWIKEGAGLNTIAVRLNDAKIPSPGYYKKSIGLINNDHQAGSGIWQTWTVGKILRCETYTGDMVQGHSKTVDHRQIQAGAENWITARNTHEAIVSRELFDEVQEILRRAAETAKNRVVDPYTPNPLKGKIFCANCGRSLHRQRDKRKIPSGIYSYHCLTHSRASATLCPGVTVQEEVVLESILQTIQQEMQSELENTEISETPIADVDSFSQEKAEHEQSIAAARSRIRRLYEDLVSRMIDTAEYHQFKTQYEACISKHEAQITELDTRQKSAERAKKRRKQLSQDAAALEQSSKLTQDLIDRLVERVEVTPEKVVHVQLRIQEDSHDEV